MKGLLKIHQIVLSAVLLFCFTNSSIAQLKGYTINAKGDTINGYNTKNEKQGKWVNVVPELRGEPGYEEEGVYEKGKKEGIWKLFTLESDLIGVENYKGGEKAFKQQYFTYLGDLIREEMWKPYSKDSPMDTVPIYGAHSSEIISYKIVPAVPYSVRHGEWKYFEPGTGRLIKTEHYEYNRLIEPNAKKEETTTIAKKDAKPKEVPKTAEMLKYEKDHAKDKKKKKVEHDGSVKM